MSVFGRSKSLPFQIKDDKEMFLLQESIEKYGILNPLIVRPVPDGYYEIISGHRRKHATVKKLLLTNKKYPYDFKIEIIGVYLFYLSSSIILYLVFTNLNKKTIKLNFSLPLTLFYIHNMDKISRIL